VKALVTTRQGGVSAAPYDSLNLGIAVGDDPEHVATNRGRVAGLLPSSPRWLRQVHGARVVTADDVTAPPDADAAVTATPGVVCVVQMADCLPVLFATADGRKVGAAHAGWRGLAAGVLENTVAALDADPATVSAWLGPAIGPTAFEVGDEVREAFVACDPRADEAFTPHGPGKWLSDLFALARLRLDAAGLALVSGGGLCTVSDPTRFFSHRRDRVSGRMAAMVWIEDPDLES
jgi:YfiH family protein